MGGVAVIGDIASVAVVRLNVARGEHASNLAVRVADIFSAVSNTFLVFLEPFPKTFLIMVFGGFLQKYCVVRHQQ